MFVGNVHFFFQQLEFVQGRRRALGSSALASAARVFFLVCVQSMGVTVAYEAALRWAAQHANWDCNSNEACSYFWFCCVLHAYMDGRCRWRVDCGVRTDDAV